MKNALILSALLTLGPVCFAQQTEKYPLGNYEELTDTKPHDGMEVWNKMTTPTQLSWGTTDIRYKKLNVPDVKKTTRWQGKAWKGERINAQAVLWTKEALDDATITVSELKSGSAVIPASAVTTNFVRYVMTDELNKDRKGGCGHRENKAEWDGYRKDTGHQSLHDTTDLVERMGSVRCPCREIQRDADRFGKEFPGYETSGGDRRA